MSKPGGGFPHYTLTTPTVPPNTRTPAGNIPPVLPPGSTQDLITDPIILLQQTIQDQVAQGYQFAGVALNISTAQAINFNTQPIVLPGTPTSPVQAVNLPQFGGGIVNLGFLQPNAASGLVYATFWLETLTHPDGRPQIMQLQYAQMTLLNFPIPNGPNLSWPHVSVATLQRTFG